MGNKNYFITVCLLFIILFASCKKFLDQKPDKSMNVPATLNDLQLVLDNYGIMNAGFPFSSELQADNYYLTSSDWNALSNNSHKNYYIWQKDDQITTEWLSNYRTVHYANIVLSEIDHVKKQPGDEQTYQQVLGSALFFRAFAFYSLVQLFAPPYDSATAMQLPGIPLRTNVDLEQISVRASLQASYDQVINDFKWAATILPSNSVFINRPSKASAFAALSRVYLATGNYINALAYSDSCLQLKHELIDFNTLNAASSIPIQRFNNEVIFPAISLSTNNLSPSRAKVDSLLYMSYEADDLRKTVFFKNNGNGSYAFKGSYDGSVTGAVFCGLATSEIYLNKSEALARLNQTQPAIDVLNMLLLTRWKTGTFIPLEATGANDAIQKILIERRKELCFRGLRWSDLRRLNKNPQSAVTLFRIIDARIYSLLPGSNGYTLQIPREVIIKTGMQQNP